MIRLYTLPSNSSSRNTVKFLTNNEIPFEEISMTKELTLNDVILITSKVDNLEDLISIRSFLRRDYDTLMENEDTTMVQLYQFILDNPRVLKAPIVISEKETQIGYNDEELATFIPRHIKKKTYLQILAEIQRNQKPDIPANPEEEMSEEELVC